MNGQTAAQLIKMASANFPLSGNANLGATAALWLKTFQNVPDDEMITAMHLCLLNCKNFPTVKDLRDAIEELRMDARTEPKLQKLPARSKWTSPAAQKAFDIVKHDKTREFVAGMDISDVAEYARLKFPDISDALIIRNYAELETAKRCADMCFRCRINPSQCMTHGWYMVPVLNSNGWIKNEMAKCQKAV